jgi:hypothetical protein
MPQLRDGDCDNISRRVIHNLNEARGRLRFLCPRCHRKTEHTLLGVIGPVGEIAESPIPDLVA